MNPISLSLVSAAITLALLSTSPLLNVQDHVFFGNLHSHTSFSDGSGIPEEAYEHARDVAGLDFLAITEHNHMIDDDPSIYNGPGEISLVSAAGRFTVDGEFVALYGQEFSSIGSGNHANVLEVSDVIDSADVPNGRWDALIQTWLPAHLDTSGDQALLLLNHPATSGSNNDEEYGADDFADPEEWRNAIDAWAELINIQNGPSHQGGSPGTPSESEYRRYLNLGFHLGPTADQDNHRRDWGSVVGTRTGVIAPTLTKGAILAALKGRHVYATQDPDLRLLARVNGHLMGSRAGVPPSGSELAIQVDILDAEEPTAEYRVEVFSDVAGGHPAEVVAIAEQVGNGTLDIAGVPFAGPGQYVFLRITQRQDEDLPDQRAWTAPVWLEDGGIQPVAGPSAVSLTVDVGAETATITNSGSGAIDLRDWRLVSERGNQSFTFPATQLAAGATLVVASGPNASPAPGRIVWTTDHMWNNDGDPGELYDEDGHLVARDPEN